MAEPLADQVIDQIKHATELYHRLMLVVAPAGTGKTTTFKEVRERIGAPLVNVNLELSCLMLDLTESQRALRLPRLLMEIVNDATGDMVLLDNIEILFDVSLKQDPLRLLQGLSRNKTIVASWNGISLKGRLEYGEPWHKEFKRYGKEDIKGMLIIPSVSENKKEKRDRRTP